MRPITTITTILFSALVTQPVLAGEAVGVSETTIHSPARGKDLAVTIWYPSDGKGTQTLSGDDRIFQGTPMVKDGAVKPGRLPLVLLSHGSGSRKCPAWRG